MLGKAERHHQYAEYDDESDGASVVPVLKNTAEGKGNGERNVQPYG